MSDIRGHTDAPTQYTDRIAGYDQRLQDLERSHTHQPQTPVGAVVAWPGGTMPPLWVAADGSALSTTAYPDLFAAIGYTWGGSGGTFNLPDLRSATIVGAGQHPGLSNRPVASRGGAETVGLTAAQTGPHTHGVTGTTGNDSPNNTHTFTSDNNNVDHLHTVPAMTTAAESAHTHPNPQGVGTGGQSGVGPFTGYSGTTGAGSAHSHTTPATNTTGANLPHTHSGTTAGVSANHTHPISSGGTDAGGTAGTAHENMSPFVALTWIIKVMPSTSGVH